MKTVIGYFEHDTAKGVVGELERARFANIVERTKARFGGTKDLVDIGIPEKDAAIYADELKFGGTLVTLTTTEVDAPRALEIMKRYGRREFKTKLGKLAFMKGDGDAVIPIVEEKLEVLKQAVDLGGIRIHPHFVEKPVAMDVLLREEHVNVARNKVDRPAIAADFQERQIAMTEHAEKAYVTKTAHVVEEIRLVKDVAERKEAIRDTLRHTEIETTKIPGQEAKIATQAPIPSAKANVDAIPIVQEEMRVGKVTYDRGGAAVRSRIVETPIEEEVVLRDESISVDRRKVDRPVTTADYEARDLQMNEYGERPLARKTAYVVEEVRLGKTAEERKETIRGTVRHTEVDVLDKRAMRTWDAFSKDYRGHFTKTYGGNGATWESYEPAYRLGHEYGAGTKPFSNVELEARDRWERSNPGTWAKVKHAFRAAFDRARGAASQPAMSR